jgi:transcriptional regulator with GAF, ATPase, and Fis domain
VVRTEAWFHFSGDNRSTEAGVLENLALAGVDLCPFDTRSSRRHGVICFTEIDDTLLTSLREMSRTAAGRVLAVAASPGVLNSRDSWRLLRSGAAEVLVWEESRALGRQIQARLERWTSVDQLVESTAVREFLVGESPAWRALVRQIVEAARFTRAPILLIGESGTGKELLAQLIHKLGEPVPESRTGRRDLVTLDCTTIVPELSGSELFGHERGAFTGALNTREGAFGLADRSTLFLDEVGELPPRLQAQLLRAVQEKTYKRVGGNVWQTTDFRLICATNRDLREATNRGEFRLDLYYRIAGWVFHTLPLSDRRDDILSLASHFLRTLQPSEDPPDFDPPVREYLLGRPYPGNVRDLRQLVLRIAHRHVGPGPITVGDIPEEDRPQDAESPRAWPDEYLEKAISNAIALGAGLKEISQATTETAIRMAVQSEKGNLRRAAKRLGVTDRALQMRRAAGSLR